MSYHSRKILCIGLVCVDIIHVVEHYPGEDTDQRCLESKWQRGGNASNTATVLSLLGEKAAFLGTVANSTERHFLLEDFKLNSIDISNIALCDGAGCPTATVILNKQNGSRTILSTRNGLREMVFEDFLDVDLSCSQLKWIHFETRPNCREMKKMLQRVEEHNSTAGNRRITVSIEFEKFRAHHEVLFGMADYVFISKDFAHHYGYSCMKEAVEGMIGKCKPRKAIICPWGEEGAAAKTPTSPTIAVPALHLDLVVDTLAAGDTFIAGTIHMLGADETLEDAIDMGCKLAGLKCGMRGLTGLSSAKDVLAISEKRAN